MCKYKDTNLGIKKLDFGMKRGAMAVFLTDGRVVIVPVSMFPDIKRLSRSQREDYMIMDDQYFSFDALSKIYSVKDVLKYWIHHFGTCHYRGCHQAVSIISLKDTQLYAILTFDKNAVDNTGHGWSAGVRQLVIHGHVRPGV